MPRATGPAADAAMPDTAEAIAPSAPDPAPWGHWRYIGAEQRIYTNVPVTVAGGEVIAWHSMPAEDGCWESTTDPVTAEPDNAPRPADPVKEG